MRMEGAEAQNAALDFILENFTIVPCDQQTLLAARALDFTDYEDAVVAVAAKKAAPTSSRARREISQTRPSPP